MCLIAAEQTHSIVEPHPPFYCGFRPRLQFLKPNNKVVGIHNELHKTIILLITVKIELRLIL